MEKRFLDKSRLTEEFRTAFNQYLLKPETFNTESLRDFSLQEILFYLKQSHGEYLNELFPKIEAKIKEIEKKFGVNDTTLSLQTFIVNYYNELSNHINFEEKVLYNFVERLLKGIYNEKEKVFALNHFLDTHNHDITRELTSIQKTIIEKDKSLSSDILFEELFKDLEKIENDLTLHGVIEDDLFIEKIHQYIAEKY